MTYATAATKPTAGHGHERARFCAAQGCPNAWSAETPGGRLCGAHAWTERHHWPRITQQQLWAETDRAQQAAAAEPEPEQQLTGAEKVALLRGLRQAFERRAPNDHKAWAHALRVREQRGEHLTLMQRTLWRDALGHQPGDEDEARQ